MTTQNQKVVIISGGTITYIRPHLAISAPAYGTVGDDINIAFLQNNWNVFDIVNTKTKMADKNSAIETTDQLGYYVDELLKDNSVKCIILAAAVCDFNANCIVGQEHPQVDFKIGKCHPRLSSKSNIQIHLEPAEKIANKIKKERPDIVLVTFKTTTNTIPDELIKITGDSLIANNSNMVIGNDIQNRFNVLVTSDSYQWGKRGDIIIEMVNRVINEL